MPATYAFGVFVFKSGPNTPKGISTGLLTRNSEQVPLTPKESAVLGVLLEKFGKVVEKKEFQTKVWPEIVRSWDTSLDNCLKRAIAALREKLGCRKSRDQYICTHSTCGYRFTEKVTILDELTMVVRPFRGKYPKKKGFIDVLTEDITNQLSRLNPQRLRLIPFSIAERYKNATITQIVEELGVGYVLEGRIGGSGNTVHVSVQLIRGTDEIQVWGGTYEKKLNDILVCLRELSQDVARILHIKLVQDEQERLDYVPKLVPEAYERYVHGRYLWNRRTPKSLQSAVELFESAIALDPSFALARSALSYCFAVIASQSAISPKEACAKAKSAATTAIRKDTKLAEPHAALGFVLSVFDRHWTQANQEFQQALKLNANCATAHHWYSFYLAARNRLLEAIQQVKIAQKLDPSPMINTNVGTMLYWARDYDAAIEQYDRVLDLESDFWYAYWMCGMAYDEKGQYRQAAADKRRALGLCPDQSPLLKASLARTLALAGDHKDARRQLKEATRAASHSALPHYHFAVAYAALGDRQAAFRSLLKSGSAHEMWISFVQVDPKIDSLRNDRRYAKLLRTLSL